MSTAEAQQPRIEMMMEVKDQLSRIEREDHSGGGKDERGFGIDQWHCSLLNLCRVITRKVYTPAQIVYNLEFVLVESMELR